MVVDHKGSVSFRLVASMFIVVGAVSASVCWAQSGRLPNATSSVDIYGNARPVYNARRNVGAFADQARRDASGSYQSAGRRVDRRGAGSGFALPGDMLNMGKIRTHATIQRMYSGITINATPARFRMFEQYGGFGIRRPSAEPGAVVDALVRRQTLIGATSLNAPIHRARSGIGSGSAFTGTSSWVPATTRDPAELGAVVLDGPTLDERLRDGLAVRAQQTRADAWDWFREGKYRGAARLFGVVGRIDPSDSEAPIGEVFSYLSTGALRTAIVTLRQLNRQGIDPFGAKIDFSNAYGNPTVLSQIRGRVRSQADVSRDNPDLRALYALVVWHFGDPDGALRAAVDLIRDHPASGYADWPDKMRAAQKILPPQDDKP